MITASRSGELLLPVQQATRTQMRPVTQNWLAVVRLNDVIPQEAVGKHEEVVIADLSDKDATHAMLEGVDAVIHLGGISVEAPFDEILQANIVGVNNLCRSAWKQSVRRSETA